jgi:hypothetical protein
MNADGTDIHQISFNPSSDMDATVLQNGRVLFTRWDNAPGRDGLHLYTSNPDGTDTQLYYGALSHNTGTVVAGVATPVEFMRAREMSDGRLMVLTRQRTDVDFGGNLTIINAKDFVENTQPLAASAGLAGQAQTPATLNDVRTVPGPSPGGRFESGFPLWDGSGRLLVSWSQCRLLDVGGSDPTRIIPCDATHLADPNAQTARPLYSIWMFTPAENTILPVMAPVEGVMVTEAVAAQPRNPLPAVILDKKPPLDANPDWVAEGVGVLSIRSVYDIMGVDQARTDSGAATSIANVSNPTNAQYAQRQVRFVRIEKPVSLPDDDDIADPDNSAFGPTGVMREIVAYAPVEPDGSVRMKVPANIAFTISLLDANGRRVNNANPHRAWLSMRPGELMECNGCHVRTTANGATARSHGRKGSFDSAYAGATATGAAFPGTVNTISPEVGDSMAQARSRGGSSCIDACHQHRALRPALAQPERRRGLQRDLEAEPDADGVVRLQPPRVVDAATHQCLLLSDLAGDLPHHHPLHQRHDSARPHPPVVVGAAPGRWCPRPGHGRAHIPQDLHGVPQPGEPGGSGGTTAAGRVARADRMKCRTKTTCNYAPIASCCSRAPSSSS